MSWRVHTASRVNVDVSAVEDIDVAYGYEHTAEEAGDECLVLEDPGNGECWVIPGEPDEWLDLALKIKKAVEEWQRNE
jgi:hypothetical protein